MDDLRDAVRLQTQDKREYCEQMQRLIGISDFVIEHIVSHIRNPTPTFELSDATIDDHEIPVLIFRWKASNDRVSLRVYGHMYVEISRLHWQTRLYGKLFYGQRFIQRNANSILRCLSDQVQTAVREDILPLSERNMEEHISEDEFISDESGYDNDDSDNED